MDLEGTNSSGTEIISENSSSIIAGEFLIRFRPRHPAHQVLSSEWMLVPNPIPVSAATASSVQKLQ